MKKRKTPSKAVYTAAAIILVLAAVLLVNRCSSGAFFKMTGPAQKSAASGALDAGDTFRSFQSIFSVKSGIKALKGQNAVLENENLVLTAENEKLKRNITLKSYRELRNSVVCQASVIGANDDGMLNYMVIDHGSNDGVSEGDGVINQDGVVGRVIKASQESSMIQLVTDTKSFISARVLRSRLVGILSGESYNRCLLNYIPKEEDIKEGDVIVTSGLGKSFPEGVRLGQVLEVNKKAEGLSMMIRVKPFVNTLAVEEVLVVKKRQN
jgi:rod shape-determining protein MreC